jgi:uncharacterized protein (DUF1697 family)
VPRYAAFLRGINIGGRRVKNDDLRACFEKMGFENVAIFIASGNVIFDADERSPAELTEHIESRLHGSLGFDATTFLRDAKEMRALAAHKPFSEKQLQRSNGKLQVALLLDKPPKKLQTQVLELATDDDPLAFGERELYWLPPGRMVESALNMRAIDKLLAPTTMRTKSTIERIAAKHFAD